MVVYRELYGSDVNELLTPISLIQIFVSCITNPCCLLDLTLLFPTQSQEKKQSGQQDKHAQIKMSTTTSTTVLDDIICCKKYVFKDVLLVAAVLTGIIGVLTLVVEATNTDYRTILVDPVVVGATKTDCQGVSVCNPSFRFCATAH